MLGGASFIADNLIVVEAPQYDLPYILVSHVCCNDLLGALAVD